LTAIAGSENEKK